MASSEGFLTEEQREMFKLATQNAEILSSSPKSPSSLLSDHPLKVPASGKAPNTGIAVRHVRRTHSGKLGRVKKGELALLHPVSILCWSFLLLIKKKCFSSLACYLQTLV